MTLGRANVRFDEERIHEGGRLGVGQRLGHALQHEVGGRAVVVVVGDWVEGWDETFISNFIHLKSNGGQTGTKSERSDLKSIS